MNREEKESVRQCIKMIDETLVPFRRMEQGFEKSRMAYAVISCRGMIATLEQYKKDFETYLKEGGKK